MCASYTHSISHSFFIYIFLKINPSLSEDTCKEGSSAVGKSGAQYKKHGAFCLETQKYADAVHHVKYIQFSFIDSSLFFKKKNCYKAKF